MQNHNSKLQEALLEAANSLFLSFGEGCLAKMISDLMDEVLGLLAESTMQGKDFDHTITTLHELYKHAKSIDEAVLSETSK